MPGWPGGLGNRLQDGRAVVDQGLGDRLQAEPGLIDQWKASLANRILSAPSKLFGGLVADPAMDLATLAGDVIHGRQPTMAADPQTGEFHTDPRLADRAMNAAGMLTLGAGTVPAETNSLRMGIRAYHGSPHDFERFDSSKIGTGEGAQAYGHGLYFAEREGVAADYRNKLGRPNFLTTKSGAPVSSDMQRLLDEGYDDAVNIGGVRGPSANDAIFMARKRLDQQRADALKAGDFDWFNKVSDQISELSGIEKDVPTTKGKMYEVDIAADPEHFLDWDKPLSEQPKALKSIEQQWGDPEIVLQQLGLDPKTAKGSDFAHAMEGLGQTNRPIAAAKMREAGIPGIRYLDQGSRTKGTVVAGDGKPTGHHNIDSMIANTYGTWEKFKAANPNPSGQLKAAIDELDARGGVKFNRDEGTSNFVVFDDKLISILRKYGLPISAAGLAALSQLHPQEAQAQPLGDRLQGR